MIFLNINMGQWQNMVFTFKKAWFSIFAIYKYLPVDGQKVRWQKKIANLRICVERAVNRIKQCRSLKGTLLITMMQHVGIFIETT